MGKDTQAFGKLQQAKAVLEMVTKIYEAGANKSSAAAKCVYVYSSITAFALAIGNYTGKKQVLEIDEPCESDYGAPNDVTFVAYLSAIRNRLVSEVTRVQSLSFAIDSL
jgi:hypothetical protein